jgi:hypothetical protein
MDTGMRRGSSASAGGGIMTAGRMGCAQPAIGTLVAGIAWPAAGMAAVEVVAEAHLAEAAAATAAPVAKPQQPLLQFVKAKSWPRDSD